jgi:hypothetical protein
MRVPALKPKVQAIKDIKSQHCFVFAGGRCASTEGSDAPGVTLFTLELKS